VNRVAQLLPQLESLWHETGLAGDTLQAQHSSLLSGLEEVLSNKITEGMQYKQQLTDSIHSYQASIRNISSELGQPWSAEVQVDM